MPQTHDERSKQIRAAQAETLEHLEASKAALASARKHGERAQLLREERERLERIYYGRRFILIRF